MGIYKEKEHFFLPPLLLLLAVAAAIYLPWISPVRELFRQEGFYAVMAQEFDISKGLVTAHQVGIKNGYPLFPAVAGTLVRLTGLPVEMVMRLISVVMLFATAAVAFTGAATNRDRRAGVVAAAVFLTSLISLEKGAFGTPATTNAFFLLSAQMLFFYFGVKHGSWNKAWLFSLFFIALAFLSGGFRMLLFFFFPMIFFRRPFSGSIKMSRPGFIAGMFLLVLAVAAWGVPYLLAYEQMPLDYSWWSYGTLGEMAKNLWDFPLMLPVRLLPWSLIAWLPFCAALQNIDKTPVFGTYLRTLLVPTLLILWLLPEYDSPELFYALGPLAVLCGVFYDTGVRRYGGRIRNMLILGEYVALGTVLIVALIWLAPEKYLLMFGSFSNSFSFREVPTFILTAIVSLAGAVVCYLIIRFGRRKIPVYLLLLCLSVCAGIFHSGIIVRYKMQSSSKRTLGADIAAAVKGHEPGKLYKSDISDLYAPLFYSGMQVVKLSSLNDLPENEEVVYVLGSGFPIDSSRVWTGLLPADYKYNNYPLGLWKGVLVKMKTFDEEKF